MEGVVVAMKRYLAFQRQVTAAAHAYLYRRYCLPLSRLAVLAIGAMTTSRVAAKKK